MSTNKPWKYQQTEDQLRIFISSRIEECREERLVIRDAVIKLNHKPILFESIGARPYPPRDLYLSRLSESHAMIAIYRSGYGYIDEANGMTISGLEDEYRFATDRGIETLFYVWKPSQDREPRLATLVAEISSGPTVAFYDDAAQLGEFVKRDLTALITSKFLEAGSHRGVLQEDSSQILSSTLNRIGIVVLRKALLDQIRQHVYDSRIVCVFGPAGIGKTTIAAQYAQEVHGRFIRASGLAPKEIFSVCAEVLRAENADAPSYSTLEGARLGVAAAWAESTSIELIVDECDFVPELIAALIAGGGFSAKKKLVFTSRESSETYVNAEVPVLTRDEVNQMLLRSPLAKSVDVTALEGGTPLNVQHALLAGGANAGSLTAFTSLQGSAGEILKYLALASWPLSAEELLQLRADDSYSIDLLATDIAQLGVIVDDSPRGYRLIHTEIAQEVAADLKTSSQKHRFFTNRLIRLAERHGTIRYAYQLAKTLQDGSADRFVNGALREASQLGDWRLATGLADGMLASAIDSGSKAEALHLMLSLVYPLDLMGAADRGTELLDKAHHLAESLGEKAIRRWEECSVSTKARRALLSADVAELKRIHTAYGEEGRLWDQARLGLELSAIYLSTKKHEEAIRILRITLATFNELGDDYGVDLSERNLASALSGLTGCEEETERLVSSISARSHASSDTRRQRAWLCNILVRRLRASGRYDEAEARAVEAIELATQLSDESLRALNLVNLGNVCRSKKEPQRALQAYENAAVAARSCGRSDIEADASRLVAGIFNDFQEMGPPKTRHEKAALYAQTAIGLLRDSVYEEAQGSAWWELADAFESLGKIVPATEAAFKSASAFRREGDSDSFARSLRYGCHLALPDHASSYLANVQGALGLANLTLSAKVEDQFLDLVVPIIEAAPRGALISVLGTHLETAWSTLPSVMQRGFAAASVAKLNEFAIRNGQSAIKDHWRILYAGIALASLMKNTMHPYLHHRLADAVTRHVNDIFAREDTDGSRAWTVVFGGTRRVVLSVFPLDDSPATSLACFVLAVFAKAFEAELQDELIGTGSDVNELLVQVSSYDVMPTDMKELAAKALGLDDILSRQACAVSRPTTFTEVSPTLVFLAPTFLSDVSMHGKGGSALELLLGLTLTELAFQLLRGQVEMDSIHSKIVSLVRRARP